MAETGVKKERTAPKTPPAELWIARQGWIKDNYCPLSVFDSGGQDLSHQTHDL